MIDASAPSDAVAAPNSSNSAHADAAPGSLDNGYRLTFPNPFEQIRSIDSAPRRVIEAAIDSQIGFNRGDLYPPTDPESEWRLGVIDFFPRAARRVRDGWEVAFSFICPLDTEIARVVFVPDRGGAELRFPPVRLPAFEPIRPAVPRWTHGLTDSGVSIEHAEAIGLWAIRVVSGTRQSAHRDLPVTGITEFIYDGHSATVVLVTLHNWEWQPEAGVFRLPTRWRGELLEFLVSDWQPLAAFRKGHFETRDWTLERSSVDRIQPTTVDAFTVARTIHDPALPDLGVNIRACTDARCTNEPRSPSGYLCQQWRRAGARVGVPAP